LLAALDGVECEAGDVAAFVVSEHGPDDAAEGAVAVQAALATLKAWLAEVSSASVGLIRRLVFRRIQMVRPPLRLLSLSRRALAPARCCHLRLSRM
jgi:hypothetical protein